MFLAIAEYVKWGPKCRLSDCQTYSKKHPFIIDGSREYKVAKFSKIPRTAESAQGWQQTLRQRTEWNSMYTLHVHRMAVREVDRAGGGEDAGAIKTKKMEGKSNQTERH